MQGHLAPYKYAQIVATFHTRFWYISASIGDHLGNMSAQGRRVEISTSQQTCFRNRHMSHHLCSLAEDADPLSVCDCRSCAQVPAPGLVKWRGLHLSNLQGAMCLLEEEPWQAAAADSDPSTINSNRLHFVLL